MSLKSVYSLNPLYKLLGKDVPWEWNIQRIAHVFKTSRSFNPRLPLLLARDASAYGIGAVLAHCMPDGSEQPVGYVSRTLNSAECNYYETLGSGPLGLFQGKMILVLVDAHSKWIEAICTSGSTSAVVIDVNCEHYLLSLEFQRRSFPITDPVLLVLNLRHFSLAMHLTSVPYHPSLNGLAERAVQLVKRGLKKITQGSMKSRLAQVLFQYRLSLLPETFSKSSGEV